MGIGDQVPVGLQQLGAQVTLLGERELATGDLSGFDAIVTGTRAYAVRDDLKTYNKRLLDYVNDGGNLIVLYNTQELVPNQFAPFPGSCSAAPKKCRRRTRRSTSSSPTHQCFTWPNKITLADFDGWVEQRGSKFWTDVGPGLHADDRDLRQGPGAAAGRLAHREVRQGHLHLLRLRAAPPAAVRRARRVSDYWRICWRSGRRPDSRTAGERLAPRLRVATPHRP